MIHDSTSGAAVEPYQITLDHEWMDCERGNILLVDDDDGDFNAWLHQQDDIWIEITWYPNNYPSLGVSLVRASNDDLWKHLVTAFTGRGMSIRKLNLSLYTEEELEKAWREAEEAEEAEI